MEAMGIGQHGGQPGILPDLLSPSVNRAYPTKSLVNLLCNTGAGVISECGGLVPAGEAHACFEVKHAP